MRLEIENSLTASHPGEPVSPGQVAFAYGISIRLPAPLPYLPFRCAGRSRLRPLRIREGSLWDHAEALEGSEAFCQGRRIRFARYAEEGDPQRLRLAVEGRGLFDWDEVGRQIGWAARPEDRDVLPYWLLAHVLPLFLYASGAFTLLHAGCVEIDGTGVAFLGGSGAGKTTLTGFAIERGHRLVCDDKLALVRSEGRWRALPAHPYHRPERRPESLGRRIEAVVDGPVPLALLCLLRPIPGSGAPEAREVSAREALLQLCAERSARFRWREKPDLEALAELARELPVVRLDVPRDRGRLGAVLDRVCRLRESLGGGAARGLR